MERRQLLSATARGNVVLDFNTQTLQAIRVTKASPPVASRAMAMVQMAMYDAIEAITHHHKLFHFDALNAPRGASPIAAAAAAADEVLDSLFPSQGTTFDPLLAQDLAQVHNVAVRSVGAAFGKTVGDAVLAWRANDGSATAVTYTPGNAPGDWVPTPPAFAAALLPQWATLAPFTMTTDAQFRPAGPPALDSQAYADAVNTTKALGAVDSATRTADRTQIANFWADGAGTATPPGHWNEIATVIARKRRLGLEQDARLFATLDVAMADAAIVAWDAKFHFNFWRPVTAIRQATFGGNPQVTQDDTWSSYLVTPNFPSYISGHSTFSGAAATVLDHLFGKHVHFSVNTDAQPGVFRSFTSFQQAAEEAGISRIYGGIHYTFDNADGLAAGRALGAYVSSTFAKVAGP